MPWVEAAGLTCGRGYDCASANKAGPTKSLPVHERRLQNSAWKPGVWHRSRRPAPVRQKTPAGSWDPRPGLHAGMESPSTETRQSRATSYDFNTEAAQVSENPWDPCRSKQEADPWGQGHTTGHMVFSQEQLPVKVSPVSKFINHKIKKHHERENQPQPIVEFTFWQLLNKPKEVY